MENETPITFQVLDAADPADVDRVHAGLRRHNEQFAESGYKPLFIFLRDGEGRLIGGILGDTYWGWLSVNTFWIDDRYRGRGYGERMLAAAEEEARRRGCAHVLLDTFSFQARPFYEKFGYWVYGTLEDFPVGIGHTRYYMTKDL